MSEVEIAATWDLLLLLASAVPLVFFVGMGIRERFRGVNALLVVFGLGFILLFPALRVFRLPIEVPLFWLEIGGRLSPQTVEVVLGGALGPILVLTGLLREVRQRRLSEEEWGRRSRLQKAALDSLPLPVFVVNEEGQVVYSNATAQQLFGTSAQTGTGNLLSQGYPAKAAPEVRDLLHLHDDLGISIEDLRSIGGRLIGVGQKPLAGETGTTGSVHWGQDLTALARFTRMTLEFAANLSHNLRTPLTSIRGYLDLLADGDLGEIPPEQRQALAVVERNVRGLEQLVGDYLDLSRLEAGAVPLRDESFDLRVAVDEAISTTQNSFDAKDVSLETLVPSDPVVVQGDQGRIVQVLCNLLDNAQKYTPIGGVVTVTLTDTQGRVQVDVADTGVGIPEKEQPQVFARFFRGSSASELGVPGSGLGLTIAKSIVELHGGKLWPKSHPGQGSTFSFTLPAAP